MFIANISLSFLFSIWYKRLWTKMIYICMVMFYFSLWFIAVTFYSKKSIPILKSFKCLHRPWTNPLVYVISISKFSLLINLELNFNYKGELVLFVVFVIFHQIICCLTYIFLTNFYDFFIVCLLRDNKFFSILY